MKLILSILFLIFFVKISIAQGFDTLYFNFNNQQTTQLDFDYKRVISKLDNNQYLIKDYYNNGKLKLECRYLSKGICNTTSSDFISIKPGKKKAKLKLNGKYITYYQKGKKKTEIHFEKGKISGFNKSYMKNGEEIYLIVDNFPKYPGGDEKLRQDILKEIKYPEETKGIHGTVYVSFVIDKNGNVENIDIASGVHPILDNEALRVIGLLEKWTPGSFKGEPANVKFTVPINFN